jgi:hypothetical protein
MSTVKIFVNSQGHAISIYFDFSQAFAYVPHTLLVQKLCLLDSLIVIVIGTQSYLSSGVPVERNLMKSSSHFPMLFGIPQNSTWNL